MRNPRPAGRMRALAPLAALAVAFTAAACGGSDSGPTAAGGSAAVDQVKVGIIPIIDVAPLKLGIEKGFFTQEGLEVTTQDAQGGAALVPAVVSGEYQFGYSNIVSLMVARSKNLPLKMVAVGARASDDELDDGSGQMMVKDPAIKTVQDLVGKTIAINTLAGINEVAVRTTLGKEGVDASTVKFIEVPIPSMPAALDEGQADAVMVGEPFVTIAARAGAHPLPVSYASMAHDLPFAGWFTTEKFVEDHRDVVDRFTAGLTRSLEYAEANPAEARAALDGYLELEAGVSDEVTLPGWKPGVDEEEIGKLADLAVETGVIADRQPLSDLLLG